MSLLLLLLPSAGPPPGPSLDPLTEGSLELTELDEDGGPESSDSSVTLTPLMEKSS